MRATIAKIRAGRSLIRSSGYAVLFEAGSVDAVGDAAIERQHLTHILVDEVTDLGRVRPRDIDNVVRPERHVLVELSAMHDGGDVDQPRHRRVPRRAPDQDDTVLP